VEEICHDPMAASRAPWRIKARLCHTPWSLPSRINVDRYHALQSMVEWNSVSLSGFGRASADDLGSDVSRSTSLKKHRVKTTQSPNVMASAASQNSSSFDSFDSFVDSFFMEMIQSTLVEVRTEVFCFENAMSRNLLLRSQRCRRVGRGMVRTQIIYTYPEKQLRILKSLRFNTIFHSMSPTLTYSTRRSLILNAL
jgi:hypothetical protein